MKKLVATFLAVTMSMGCNTYFPDALSSNTKIKGRSLKMPIIH